MPKDRPVHEVRIGLIKAAIWKNSIEGGGVRHNVTFNRSYKADKDAPWSSTDSFGRDDLLLLAKVANEAHTWICAQSHEESTAAPASPPSRR